MSTTGDAGARSAEVGAAGLDRAAVTAIDAVRGPRGALSTGSRARLYAAILDPASGWDGARSIVVTPDGLTSLELAVARYTRRGSESGVRAPTAAEVLGALFAATAP